ncbi:MAG: PilZ domain-containing protein [Nitrospinae bacterium]|nr:PilZ domain-containing protein [Nitrospinota bacterium]
MSRIIKPAAEVITLYTASHPVEKFCAVGDPLIIEWKGKRYPSLMRGAKAEVIATNTLGGKGRISVLADVSFFIVDMPKGYAAAGFLNNSPLTVRFFSSGSVYAFHAKLMRLHSQPPVLVLEYPEKLQRYNLRSNERISIVTRARVSKNGGSDHQMGALLDISDSGAKLGLDTVEGIDLGMMLHLSFILPNGVAVSQLTAAVRNINEENGKYLLGISLSGHDPAVAEFCRNCLECLE